jgi:hypothetical protein
MPDVSGTACGPHKFSDNDIIAGTRDSRGAHISVIIPVIS